MIAEAIESLIHSNNDQNLNEWNECGGRNYTAETIDEFRVAVDVLKKAYVYAQRIDWLVSGDDGEDTFHARLNEDLEKLK
jgi:hypothetical protein